jgi:hypothetical protein
MSVDEARGRFEWMKKCSEQVPMIHEFLAQYDHSGGKLANLTYKGNIIYASFMDKSSTPEKKWIAPKSSRSSCEIPTNVYIAAICVVDCATPEQPVMAQSDSGKKLEYIHFENAWNDKFKFVGTLGEKSTLESKTVQRTPVDQWVQSAIEDHMVIEFTLQSGRHLRVTPGHPLVDSSGRMREAREFKVGETLTMLGGQGDGILSMEEKNIRGRVYNLYVKADDVRRNIIVINGYLSGTAYYAGPGIDQMNRMVLRSALTHGVFE